MFCQSLQGDCVKIGKFKRRPAFYQAAGCRLFRPNARQQLEEYGIGARSTYAPTSPRLSERNVPVSAEARPKKLKPDRQICFVVNDLLWSHFPQIVDFKFTPKWKTNHLMARPVAEANEMQPSSRFFINPSTPFNRKYEEVDKE